MPGVGGELMAELGDIGRSSVMDAILFRFIQGGGRICHDVEKDECDSMSSVNEGLPRVEKAEMRRGTEASSCASACMI